MVVLEEAVVLEELAAVVVEDELWAAKVAVSEIEADIVSVIVWPLPV